MINALAPWYGSNRMLAKQVGKLLQNSKWVGIPFVGGGAELKEIKARTVVAADTHCHIINLAKVISDQNLKAKLQELLSNCLLHPIELINAQTKCVAYEDSQPAMPDLDWAKCYFISAWMSRNGMAGTEHEFKAGLALRYTAKGGDSVVRFRNAVTSLDGWHEIIKRFSFSTDDVFVFLDKTHDLFEHAIYCDPPFPGAGDLYKHKFTKQQHIDLEKRLSEFTNCLVVCRFHQHSLIDQLYKNAHWHWLYLTGRKQTNNAADELLICNRPIEDLGLDNA